MNLAFLPADGGGLWLGSRAQHDRLAPSRPRERPMTRICSQRPTTGRRRVSGPTGSAHGGLAQQGYPISDEFTEVSDLNGKPYTVQYFERAVFEKHPENQPPFDVLLSLLGTFRYKQKYPQRRARPDSRAADRHAASRRPATRWAASSCAYWKAHGGLAQQGYPISDEFTEVSDLNGKPYTVQYFERAVFELHPENAGTPYEVLLSQLGHVPGAQVHELQQRRDPLLAHAEPGQRRRAERPGQRVQLDAPRYQGDPRVQEQL